MSLKNTTATTNGSVVYNSGNNSGAPDLRFLHYNDVYHVEAGSRDPVGGIARFKTLCTYYQKDQRFAGLSECLTFFSGDAFNPSLESSVTKGKHMVPVLNAVNTSAACLGNHDLDFGVDQFQYLSNLCKFPWLCANVLDPALGEKVPLGSCQRTVMLTSSNGIRIGVIGLVEREWLDTINTLPPNLEFQEPHLVATELATQLRKDGAEIVIALTHQRQPNDDRLARELEPGIIDIILSGHDHFYAQSIVNGTQILRSGTDFKQLSYLEIRRKAGEVSSGSKWDFNILRRDVVSAIPQEPHAVEMVEKITSALKAKLEKPIGYTAAPLDARFSTVRLKESNLGNFVCDILRFHYNADCCIMAAGTIRGDQIYPPGILKVKDIMNCFPFEDPCVVISVSGRDIVQALENGVSKYPAQEGRFPQVSNIAFTFDPTKHEGQRCSNVRIADLPVEMDRQYKMATRDYMVRGKDGFHSLMLAEHGGAAKSVVSEENGMLLSMVLRQYFMSLKVLGRWKNWATHMTKHWESVHEGVHEVHPVREPVQAGEACNQNTVFPQPVSAPVSARGTGTLPNDQKAQGENGEPLSSGVVSSTDLEHNSDSEDDAAHVPTAPAHHAEHERKRAIMRKVMTKWRRLAELSDEPSPCEEKGRDFGVNWTRGICPKTEGRINIVNGAAIK